ncbi:MAG: TraR/DksA C4-type zinc finger protein [Elusimicrobia bacterium]|nr:TraR/DksA C4-type zinc finger protein [Elusimicrobiota bacterium]
MKKNTKKTTKKTAGKNTKKIVSRAKSKRPVTGRSRSRPAKKSSRAGARVVKEVLSKTEMDQLASRLKEMKDSVSKTVEDKKKMDLPEPEVGDSIDQASQSLEKEILFELSDSEMGELGDIEAALRKIENGTYGVCEHCKRAIEKKRIKAIPSARYCMVCQSGSERHRTH